MNTITQTREQAERREEHEAVTRSLQARWKAPWRRHKLEARKRAIEAESREELAAEAAADARLEVDEEDVREQIEVAYSERDEQGVEAALRELDVVEAKQRAAGYYVADRPAGEHRRLVRWLTTGEPMAPRWRPLRGRGPRLPTRRDRNRERRCLPASRRRSSVKSGDPPPGDGEPDLANAALIARLIAIGERWKAGYFEAARQRDEVIEMLRAERGGR